MNINRENKSIIIGINENRFKPTLKNGTGNLMLVTKPIGIGAVKIMDAFRQIGFVCFVHY